MQVLGSEAEAGLILPRLAFRENVLKFNCSARKIES